MGRTNYNLTSVSKLLLKAMIIIQFSPTFQNSRDFAYVNVKN